MTRQESGIARKKTEELLVASVNFQDGFEGKKMPSMFEGLLEKCKDYVCGPPIAVFDYGVYSDGLDVEVCFPVTQPIQKGEVKSRILESAEVLSIIHHGPYEGIKETRRKLYNYLREHEIVGTNFEREIVLKFDAKHLEENVIEIQAVLHGWEDRFARSIDRVLGIESRRKIMQDSGTLFACESKIDERVKWIKAAIKRLNELASEEQKYDILSCCAHDFSQKRIEKLRAVYEQLSDVDEVIKMMRKDPGWYEHPRREGNTIHVRKIPYDRKNYERATDKDQKRRYYCHCPMVRDHLGVGISPTFCYCGAGWYRQIWEGILQKPVKVEIEKSLLKGDDTCEFTIHLPNR